MAPSPAVYLWRNVDVRLRICEVAPPSVLTKIMRLDREAFESAAPYLWGGCLCADEDNLAREADVRHRLMNFVEEVSSYTPGPERRG